jgi:hypothetical protein
MAIAATLPAIRPALEISPDRVLLLNAIPISALEILPVLVMPLLRRELLLK